MITGNHKSLKLDGSNISSMNTKETIYHIWWCLLTFLLLMSQEKKHSRANFHYIN